MTVVIVAPRRRRRSPRSASATSCAPRSPRSSAPSPQQGVGVTMLTGDNARTAARWPRRPGSSDVRAELRPEDKAAAIAELVAGAARRR